MTDRPGEGDGTMPRQGCTTIRARVAVLLATYNGADFLDAQLQSLAAQTVDGVDVWASDDGSRDESPAILRDWARRWPKGRFEVLDGPGRGFARNFTSLLVNEAIDAEFFAFCDQDDIWDADKLARAVACLGQITATPRAYGARTRLISEDGRPLGHSPLFPRKPEFRNAIVQSIAGGNTIVVDRAAREILVRSLRRTEIVSHDWWVYLIVTGAGGTFHYDPEASISYRQHDENMVGANDGWRARMRRLRRMVDGVFRDWNETHVAALSEHRDLLSDEARAVLDDFEIIRRAPLPTRLRRLAHSRIFRQTPLGNLGLYAACCLRRM